MEAVSAAASIAGLLSIAGHVVNGLIKLNDFVQAAKEMDIRTESLNAKVGLLSETLEDVNALLQTYERSLPSIVETSWEPNIATLRSHLVRCGKDLDEWSKSYKSVKKSTSKRRKFLDIIQNKRLRGISDMEIKLTAHRSQLIFDISVLNAASSLRKIYSWKLGILARSDHFLTILWYEAVFGNRKNLVLSSMDGAGKFLMILKDAFPWDGLVNSMPDNASKMDVDEEDESSSWTRSDGAVDLNMSDTVSREGERPSKLIGKIKGHLLLIQPFVHSPSPIPQSNPR
ncbi:hypothetical protein BDP81DRAFT_395490 [Colletotrichum phormii]|uniref:Fungal N-terminal domain-containing protein n=1 Tax=Colletotrichum phormii TaxID=359342 RepID=A0AAI9ZNN3_9PEZI|nr:uncharacterized protein BDP81DRAFT_395490 [Colletotrichum phormii]KAK1635016.1 hypothetical protein BDP81DRAFT_395490 [Colletotrichum phormii]